MRKKSRRLWKKKWIAMLALMAAGKAWGADSTNSVDDPLLDLFIKKGYVTTQEASQVEAEANAQRTNNMAAYPPNQPKWSIVPGIKDMQLFGDVRLRYESRTAEDPQSRKIELNRLRFALRFGLRGDASDNFYYGLRIETSANPRSPWVTMGTQSGTGTPYQVPFGKSSSGLGLGQIYLGWKWQDYVDITAGAMPNYLYTTPMVWDNDLNPLGAFERFKYTVGQADLFATFGQFLYVDTNPTATASGYFDFIPGASSAITSSQLPFMLAWQGGFNYRITENISLKAAPVLYQYLDLRNEGTPANGGVGPDFDGTFVGQGQVAGATGILGSADYNLAGGTPGFDGFYSNETGVNDLLVLDVPAEFNVKLYGVNVRFFGDYAYNFEGVQRAQAAYTASRAGYFSVTGPGGGTIETIPSPQTHDVHAYQFGVGIGSRDMDYGPEQGLVYGTQSVKHGWEIRTYWQHVEQYALDPNLVDSDFFEGRENLQGIYVAFSYALSQNFLATVRYGNAQRINPNVGTGGGNQDIPQMNPISHYQLFQADATLRF
jgi:hypothetical protein